MAQKYQELSDKIVGLVGGKANVQFFTHCVTRLRFNVKDESAVKKDEIEKLPGVLGSQWQNGQYQIIIGQAVNDVYRLICEKNGFAVEKSVDEKLDDEKPAQKKGVKAVIDKIFDGISGSLTPLIPALIGCGMIKVILILMDMAGVPADKMRHVVIAYEPLWAIGTGKTATAEQAGEVCQAIRAVIRKLYGAHVARSVTIQYGGSMNAKNAAELLAQPDVDGGLIGGASLKPADFVEIINAANQE